MGKLYLVPTPIGNLDDMTFRAIKVLKEVDVILAEDTRNTGKLLKHFGIESRMFSHHQHNEHKALPALIDRLKQGEELALVTDAGTPGISDPGFLLIRACIENNIAVECLPGATAFIPAAVVSGLPVDRFHFEGFLPQKKGRSSKLKELSEKECTVILYESPFRVIKTLKQLSEYFGTDRRISISRELTKIHEETIRGSIEEVIEIFEEKNIRGEFVIVIEGKKN